MIRDYEEGKRVQAQSNVYACNLRARIPYLWWGLILR